MNSQNKEILRINGYPNAGFPGTPGDNGGNGISYLFFYGKENENSSSNSLIDIYINDSFYDTYAYPEDTDNYEIKVNDYAILRNENNNKIEFRKIAYFDDYGNMHLADTPEFSFPMLKN